MIALSIILGAHALGRPLTQMATNLKNHQMLQFYTLALHRHRHHHTHTHTRVSGRRRRRRRSSSRSISNRGGSSTQGCCCCCSRACCPLRQHQRAPSLSRARTLRASKHSQPPQPAQALASAKFNQNAGTVTGDVAATADNLHQKQQQQPWPTYLISRRYSSCPS